ncbi:uncharacterized protein LOC111038410 [Myzus persicae]|uniref:uncharacterized protein LOC111038410 n=1 Tax=Myzus persicae TaxID=13164 RepID=UPI000B92FFFD|nr:uncharacterized protein LOC111038410 [Myzus persicae]
MEKNDKASISPYNNSDSSDDDDEQPENLSTEEICLKIKTFRNLCLGNKINVGNAFDINMIGYFYSWLEKKKSLIFDDDKDSTSFQEISDYLEATAKVYSYRVDNLTETTSKLVEQFKSMNYAKSTTPIDDEDDAPKIQKSKRQKMMLTTNEKLRAGPDDIKNTFNSDLMDHAGLNFNELFFVHRPSRLLTSMYHDTTLAEEMQAFKDEQKKFDEKEKETISVDISFLDDMEKFAQGVICPEFNGFVAERDKVDNHKEDNLDGIEYRFDPDIHQFLNDSEDSICGEPDNTELDSNSNDKDTSVFDGLVECIDGVNSDYSLFNPKLLAKWNGPKAWKAQAMMKALKSCTPSERKDIVSNEDENIDECTQESDDHIQTNKKRIQVKNNDTVQINWLDRNQINELIKNNIRGKEQILPRTLQKWQPVDHLSDVRTVVVDIKYEFNFLKYTEIKPEWWERRKNYSASKELKSRQNINACGESVIKALEATEIDNEDPEQSTSKNDEELITNDGTDDKLEVSKELNPEDEDAFDDQSESRMDIAELKKEISDIIDEECVETDPNSEWSSKLSFLNLLTKLRINERDGLTIPIIFVGLLHLANERGLKLFQEYCTINDMEETFIAKPMKNNEK